MSNARRQALMSWILGVVIVCWLMPTISHASKPQAATSSGITKSNVVATMLQAPLSFEANQGQSDPSVKFIARGKGYTLFLTPTESVMVLQQREAIAENNALTANDPTALPAQAKIKQAVVRMKLKGANQTPTIDGMKQLPGIVNYFIGSDPAKWRTKIPTYAKVQYQDAYPGIDLAYYGNQGKLEYDFIVQPGADPNQIKVVFDGAERIDVDPVSGDLVLTLSDREATNSELSTQHSELGLGASPTMQHSSRIMPSTVRMQKPLVYQIDSKGHKRLVAGNYVVHEARGEDGSDRSPFTPPFSPAHSIGLQVAGYDPSRPLVIDPVFDFSTYLGGSSNDNLWGMAVDAAGSTYLTGRTYSAASDFTADCITPCNVFDGTPNGGYDVFITKLRADGSALLYSTYLGGNNEDHGFGIAVDAAGNAYVTGLTNSSDFTAPCTTPCVVRDASLGGGLTDAFVTKLSADGSQLLYSTYLGGAGEDAGSGIALDAAGNAYIAGSTTSANFTSDCATAGPPCTVRDGSLGGTRDFFVTKLSADGSQLLYSTYLGGSNIEFDGTHTVPALAVDAAGYAYVTGGTFSTDFTSDCTLPCVVRDNTLGGTSDAFVTKLAVDGSALVYSTYLGGNFVDGGAGIAVDAAGNAYVLGFTASANFTADCTSPCIVWDGTSNGGDDAFVTKLSADGSQLLYSTYLGGNSNDYGFGIAVDGAGSAHVSVWTYSTDFTATCIAPCIVGNGSFAGGPNESAYAKLKADGSALLYSTYLGGDGDDRAYRVAVDAAGNAYLAGSTTSTNFTSSCTPPCVVRDGSYAGGDGFIAKISFKPIANAGPDQSVPEGTLVILDGTASSGRPLTYSWTQVAGPPAALGGANTANPTFSAPSVPAAGATATFLLVVCEGSSSNCSAPDSVDVHITNANQPPVAEAGPDQTVQEGSPVLLDGTGSYDPDVDTLTYQWTQTLGPAVSLLGGATALPTFVAPNVGTAGATLAFNLTVTDPYTLTGSDAVSIHVTNVNQIPIPNAGPDQTVNENTLVTLNGTGSSDPNLDALSFIWSQTDGPLVSLTGATSATPAFTAPSVGVGGAMLTFRLIVSDGQASSAADTVMILVQDTSDPPICTLAQPSVTSLWPPNHTMVPVTITGVTDPNNQTITITYPAVTQEEPVNGLGDGDTSPDAAVSGNQILLRAERDGTGNGRVYVVHFTASNDQGGSCSGSVKVGVPLSKKAQAIEGPQLYNSFGP